MLPNINHSSFLNFIINPINNQCNLSCKYCYNKEKNLRKVNYKNFRNLPILSWFPKLLNGLNSLSSLKIITFTWHGGEPLLLPDKFYLTITDLEENLLKKNIKYNNVIQTNGVLLNHQKAIFLSKLNFNIGVSLDGPEYKHNKQRFHSRKNFEKAKNNIFSLSRSNIPFALFMVIHEKNVNSTKEIFSFLKRLSPQNGVSFIPRFNKTSYLSPNKYKKFLKEIFNLWLPERKPYIAILENFLSGLNNHPVHFCFLNNRCDAFISLDADGKMYSTCQVDKQMKVGNINEDNIKTLILKHELKINKMFSKIANDPLCIQLGNKPQYQRFLGKGCPKRLINRQDPYTRVLGEVIQYIENEK